MIRGKYYLETVEFHKPDSISCSIDLTIKSCYRYKNGEDSLGCPKYLHFIGLYS